jgi:hypothetical protein
MDQSGGDTCHHCKGDTWHTHIDDVAHLHGDTWQSVTGKIVLTRKTSGPTHVGQVVSELVDVWI